MDRDFAAAYKQLNDEQRRAVDQIDGPVLVIAGPGTGKTQLLSLRVANILQKTDTDPGSILCLTFTNYAATNMRQRLQTFIGGDSRKVAVKTFHSFASDIMESYPDYFWNGAQLQIAPDSVQLDTVQSVLAELPLDNPLASKFSGQFTALGDVQLALKLTKEAGLTPDKLAAMIGVNTAYIDVIEEKLAELFAPALSIKRLEAILETVEQLPDQTITDEIMPLQPLSLVLKQSLTEAVSADMANGKTTNTGRWKRRWLQAVDGKKGMFDERKRNDWWLAFSDIYATYRRTLHAKGYYDYSDMLVEVITQLERNPDLRASVQERYLYVLIDEFQDTNAAQFRLAHLVASHYTDENKPNLMAVGDDDQTIFAFNGAELNNMLTFRRSYPDTSMFILKENYRSTQAILNTADKIISQAEDRIVNREPGLSKQLHAATVTASGEISHVSLPTREHQYAYIADKVEQAWKNGAGEETVAVLARNHDSLKALSGILNQRHIPMRYELQNNILEDEAVAVICLLADTVQSISLGNSDLVNSYLARLLQHPMWSIPPLDLWKLSIENQRSKDWLGSLISSGNVHLQTIGSWLQWLSTEAAHQDLQVLLEYFIGLRAGEHLTSPVREFYLAYTNVSSAYLQSVSAVNTLLAQTAEYAGNRPVALSDFVDFIHLNKELGRSIVDQSWFVSGDKAVHLMTVHKAKGLEFDTVFLIDAVESSWQPRRIGRKPPANLPMQPYGEVYDDYIRLLYVAATRAKRSFVAASYAYDTNGKEVLPTPLLTNSLPSIAIPAKELPVATMVLEQAIRWPRLENAEEKKLLADRLEKFQLSPSALCKFLDLTEGGPDNFIFSSLISVPEATSTHAGFGNAVHKAMQVAQQLTKIGKFNVPEVVQAYREHLQSQIIPVHDKDRYGAYGEKVLVNLFEKLEFKLPADGKAEVNLRPDDTDTVRICGRLDHVHETSDNILITDYKTGAVLTSLKTRDKSKLLKAWRHNLQLTFYANLVRKSELFADKPITTRIVYIEADDPKSLILELTPTQEEMDRMERLLKAVWHHIREYDMPDTSIYSADFDGVQKFIEDLIAGKTKTA